MKLFLLIASNLERNKEWKFKIYKWQWLYSFLSIIFLTIQMSTAASWKQQLFQTEQRNCWEGPSAEVQVSQFRKWFIFRVNFLKCEYMRILKNAEMWVHKSLKKCRQLRGEDLQGLNIEELQQLERSLETGLGRVIEKKVYNFILFFSCGSHLHNMPHNFFYIIKSLLFSGREDYEWDHWSPKKG